MKLIKSLANFRGTPSGLFLFFVLFLPMACTKSASTLAKQPVVQVNDHVMTAQEFGDQLAKKLKNYDALYAKQESNLRRIKDNILNEFITSVIMAEYGKESGLSLPDSEIEEQINKVRGSYPDDISFRSALAEENLSLESWRNSVRRSIYEKRVFQAIAQKVKDPSEEEIISFYKGNKNLFNIPPRVKLRQIVLEKEEDAKRIMARLKQGGTNIDKLAREFSVAPEGKNGGDTGWIEKGALEVFDIAFTMRVGGRSGIIKSSYGFHIFEVVGKKASSQMSLAEAKPKIVANLRAEKEKLAFEDWLEEQMKKATIKRDEKLISSIQVHTER